MTEKQESPDVQVLERGNIVFFYRPRQGVLHPKNPDDLERAYFMLLPDDQKSHKNRMLNVAHGVFPTIVPGRAEPEERDWAFVQDVGTDPKEVLGKLQKNINAPPEPSGQRARPWARAAGEGRYAIVRHEDHTHLAYQLKPGQPVGKVQRELEIKPEASYVVSVKDPFTPSEINLKDKPNYPLALRNKFDGHGWISIEPTSYLDYQWSQILLIGANRDVHAELGISFHPDRENAAEKAVHDLLEAEDKEAGKQHVSVLEPLEEGKWE